MDQKGTRRVWLWVIGILVFGAVASGAGYGYWIVFNYRFSTVTEGKVYRSGQMPVDELTERVETNGIKTIVDLRKPEDQKLIDSEHDAMSKLGIQHINLPSEQVPDDETVQAFFDIMDNPDNLPVLIHCHHGEGRAVLFSAVYLMEYEGWDNERARDTARLILWRSSFSADRDKGKYLINYTPREKSNTSE